VREREGVRERERSQREREREREKERGAYCISTAKLKCLFTWLNMD
jgi:hypothetical protein